MPNGLLVGALRARSCLELLVFLPAKPAYRSVFTFLGHAPRVHTTGAGEKSVTMCRFHTPSIDR